jgi:hypothetical protein
MDNDQILETSQINMNSWEGLEFWMWLSGICLTNVRADMGVMTCSEKNKHCTSKHIPFP